MKHKIEFYIINGIISLLILSSCSTVDDDTELKSSMAHVAEKLQQKGDYKNALQFYEKASREEPNNLELKIKYATILNLLQLYPDARRELRNVLKIDNTLVNAKVELTKTYLNENKPEEALKLLDQIKEAQDLNANLLMLYGIANDLMKNFGIAQDYYVQALKLESNNNHIQSNYGLSLALSGQVQEGIKILEEINRLSTATAKDRHNLALAYGLNGQFNEAKELLSQDMNADKVNKSIQFLKRVKNTTA